MTSETSTFTTLTTGTELARLGDALAADGVARHEDALAAVAARARRVRVAEAASAVLADRNAVEIVRLRAFAVVCRELARSLRFEPTGPVALVA